MEGGSHSRVQSNEVQTILTSTSSSAAPKPSPVEHVSVPSSPSMSGGSSARTSFQSHARTISTATDTTSNGPPRSNRFSVSFPVQSCDSTSRSPQRSSTIRRHEKSLSEAPPAHGPTDMNFLTAIASSERRVLELKEELQRAEADLNALKRQWAQHEATKKKEEVRMLTKLQPFHTTSPTVGIEDDTDGSSAWMQHEMERRKALLHGRKSSNRTVFAGSRHTRTLSLLSPGATDAMGTFSLPTKVPRKDSLTNSSKRGLAVSIPEHEPPAFKRASTALSDITLQQNNIDGNVNDQSFKKIATDLKDGLLTFWEDLRQATVGQEATQQIAPAQHRGQVSNQQMAKKQSSRSNLKSSADGRRQANKKSSNQSLRKEKSGPALADPSFWIEHGIASSNGPSKTSSNIKPPASPKPSSVAESDTWDWEDSPKEARTILTLDTTSKPKHGSDATTPVSAKMRESIPWPALSRAGSAASQLRRTASHLMNEWEKSLTPSPGQEYTGQEDYLSVDVSNPGNVTH